jgi:glycosyltransferase involved in cell wall biosynthesis
MLTPTVTVLMAVHDGERYLREAIDSILEQTFSDFEFVIVDDHSADATPALLEKMVDTRIIRLRNTDHMGLAASLNRGLDAARGRYIARMDADDISLPPRLEQQIHYLDEHADIGIVGTNTSYIDAEGQPLFNGQLAYSEPLSPAYLRWLLLWKNPLPHPTVMLRRSLIEQTGLRYDPAFETAQDYDYCSSAAHTNIGLIPEVGLKTECLRPA